MTFYEFLGTGLLLFAALGGANFMLGRSQWRRPRLAKWVVGLITTIIMIIPPVCALYVCMPDVVSLKRLDTPVNAIPVIILAFMIFAAIASAYGYCFRAGDRHGIYVPNPNRVELEDDDLPPMPTTK